jgi:tRNA(Ile)-lysidine synthase
MSLEGTFQRTVQRHRLFEAGQRVVVAVSGGADSTALLHLMAGLARKMPLELHVAHLDHGRRGEESAGDRRFVEAMAAGLGLKATCRALEPGAATGERQMRELRHRFLEETAEEIGAQRIATGHTRDDQAETLLLNLLRGAGSRGLAGIPPHRERFVRPLLEAPRSAVEEWLRQREIGWREDASNRDRSFARNRLRHDLIPLLERETGAGLAERLATTASLLREDDALLEELAAEFYGRLARREESAVSLDAAALVALPPALARRTLRRAYREAGDSGYAPGSQAVAAMVVLAAGEGGSLDLPGGVRASLEADRLVLHGGPEDASVPFEEAGEVPGELAWPEAGIFLKMQEVDRMMLDGDIKHESREIAYLDLDRTGRHLTLRSRRPGDAFYPLGLGGRKKIQDFLVDAGVPRRERGRVGLLTAGEEIAWLVGHRLDDRFKVTESTRKVLVVRQERE